MLIIWAAVMAAMKAAAAAAAKKAAMGAAVGIASRSKAGSMLMGMAPGGGGKEGGSKLPEPMKLPEEAQQQSQGLTMMGAMPAERPPVKTAQAQTEAPATRMSRGLTGGEMVVGGIEGLLFGGGPQGIPRVYESMRRTKANAPYVGELERRLEAHRSNDPEGQRRLELEKMLAATKGTNTPDYMRRAADQAVSRPRYTQGPKGQTFMEEMSAVQRDGRYPSDEEFESSGKRPIGRDPISDSQESRKRLADGVRARIKTSNMPPIFVNMFEGQSAMNAYKEFYPDEYAAFWQRQEKGSGAGMRPDAAPGTSELEKYMQHLGLDPSTLNENQRGLIDSYLGAQ